MFFAWGAALALLSFPLWGWRRRRRRRSSAATSATSRPRCVHVAGGAGALYAAPWLARGVAAVQVAMARLLLEPGERERLTARVDTLEETRAGMVAAADAERRRIERDLHDGAQQRLVALAMTLGRAKATEDPALARTLVDEAHGEAKEALVELRNLARGIHPAVLTDRGLDAAVSALAARCPVPVAVDVDLPHRAGPAQRGDRVLRRRRGADQRRQARPGHPRLADRRVPRRPARGRGARQRHRRRARHRRSASAACATASAPSTATCICPSPPGGGTTLRVELPCEP